MAPDLTPPTHVGVKRTHSSTTDTVSLPRKRQRVHHVLRRTQARPSYIEPAPQDQIFAQGQLLKSIGAALAIVGFDSVKPSALEMFRSHVEEYMLQFLTHARTAMHNSRRTAPTVLDFAAALASMPNAATASLLKAQLKVQVPEDVAYPEILGPDPSPLQAPDFSTLLAPLMAPAPRTWIPKHFPSLPPSHAWESTPDFPQRERDVRNMREQATQEGMLAEQALRRLAAAAKTSAINAEKRRNSVLSGSGKIRDKSYSRKAGTRVHEDSFADVLKDVGGLNEAMDLSMEGMADVAHDGVDLGMPEGVAVNHGMSYWRKGASRRS